MKKVLLIGVLSFAGFSLAGGNSGPPTTKVNFGVKYEMNRPSVKTPIKFGVRYSYISYAERYSHYK